VGVVFITNSTKSRSGAGESGADEGLKPLPAASPGGRGGMRTEGVNAGLPAGTPYEQGSASSSLGEHDLQLTQN